MISAGTTAFGAGLLTGLHCIGMCGPLTCALCPKAAGSWKTLGVYHITRAMSYAGIGATLGLAGRAAGQMFVSLPAHTLSWALFAFFLALGLGLERWAPLPTPLRKSWSRAVSWSAAHPYSGAALLGVATPVLPCGPLYLAFAVALTAGSAFGGGALMGSFALGTIAPLFLAQAGFLSLRDTLGRGHLATIQRTIALVAAGLVLWRILAGAPFQAGVQPRCPMCPPAASP